MGFWNKRPKEPSYAQHIALQEQSRPPQPPTSYQPSSILQHHFTLDEKVLDRLDVDPNLQDAIPAFGVTADTNFLDKKSVKLLQIKTRKAFLYLQLRMKRSTRRLYLPYLKFLEANSFGRSMNNFKGAKIKALVTQEKRIVTGEAKKVEM